MRSAKKVAFLFFIIFLKYPVIWGQINILPGGSTFEMGTALTGNGVTIVGNPTINCSSLAYGSFSNGQSTNLGITNGVLLTTGSAAAAAGPNDDNGFSTQLNSTFSDPNLLSIEPTANNDVCSFELDVIPQCDSLTIRFIFGSEEYPEFVNSGFNDAFGFFVSGANPNGGVYNAVNIARLPNNTIVTIDNVNANTNSQYFVNNAGGSALQYNGYTVVLSPRIKVVPCQTYHFKLIIGDAGDDSFDSGVLIDFISCTTAIEGTVNTAPSGCELDNGTATIALDGGIGPFQFDWSHDGNLNGPNATNLAPGNYQVEITDLGIPCAQPLNLDFTIIEQGPTPNINLFTNANNPCSGDTIKVWAISDSPYEWSFPTPANIIGDTAFFTIGNNFAVTATATNLCGPSEVSLNISSVSSPNVNINTPPIICAQSNLVLNASLSGFGFVTWETPNGSILNGLNVNLGPSNLTQSGWYYASSSFGGCEPQLDSVQITIVDVPTTNISAATICLGQTVNVEITPAGNYNWNLLEGADLSNNGSNAILSPTVNSTYIVSDNNNCSVTIQIQLLPLPEPLTTVSTLQGCAPLSVQFTDNTIQPLSFQWNFGDGGTSVNESPFHIFSGGNADTVYFVSLTVTDNNGCSSSSGFFIQTMLPAVANFAANPISQIYPNATVDFSNLSSGSGNLNSIWTFENESNNNFTNVNHTFSTWGEFEVQLVTSNEWCSDTTFQTISILPPAAIAAFSFQDSGCPGSQFTFTSESIFAESVTWVFPDSTQGSGESITHQFDETGSYNITLLAHGFDGVTDTFTIENAVTIHPLPVALFVIEEQSVFAVVDSAVFHNQSTGANSYVWNFGNGNSSTEFEPTPHFDLVGNYDITLTVTNEFGCQDQYKINNGVIVTSDGFIQFPSAFSPLVQGATDGSYDRFAFDNNIFHPHSRSVQFYELSIFNKWGELLFSTDNVKQGWDGYYQGQMVTEDTYVFKSKGQLFGGVPFEKSGTVTLLLK